MLFRLGMRVPRDFIWMDLFPTASHGINNDGIREAWDHYRLLITLAEQLPEHGYAPQHGRRMPKEETYTDEQLAELKKAADLLANSI